MSRQVIQITFLTCLLVNQMTSHILNYQHSRGLSGAELHDSTNLVLEELHGQYPEITELYPVGHNSWNRSIYAIKLSKSNGFRLNPKPQILLSTDMSKDETVGREILMRFVKFLITGFRNDTKISWILENSQIHVIPSINPSSESSTGICHSDGSKQQIELNLKNNFVLSAEIQSGGIGATYPFYEQSSSIITHTRGKITPDHDIFQHLSRSFLLHLGDEEQNFCLIPARKGQKREDSEYIFHGTLKFQFQVRCCDISTHVESDQFFNNVSKGLVGLIQNGHMGIKGRVTVVDDEPLKNAKLKILGRDVIFHTNDRGEFFRILLPGVYILKVYSYGFKTETIEIVVDDRKTTNLAIRLEPLSPKKIAKLEERFDGNLVRRLKTFSLTTKDWKNLIEWSFSLLNIINVLNIVGFYI